MGERERNPARTRAAVLDAAERLFAERGFDATSVGDVGAAAGVSRGTPGYFFGSKSALYRAVLDRCFDEVRAAIRAGRDRATASGKPPEAVLAGAVADYFDFLVGHPNFVRLIEREALRGRRLSPRAPHLAAGEEALAALGAELGLVAAPEEAAHLLLSIVALCWFPLVHAHTVAAPLGVDLATPAGLGRRRRHVIELVLHALRGRAATATLAEAAQNA
jgi:TetR/AcrR family transcriptional regulator